jgi:hypothetical protein
MGGKGDGVIEEEGAVGLIFLLPVHGEKVPAGG